MAKQTSNGNAVATEQPDLKRKLAWRMGFAGLMIVALLATLAVFDRLSAPDEVEPATPRFTEPVPVARKEVTQPVKPADPVPETEQKTAAPESSAAPVDKSLPQVEAPARPEVYSQPVLPRAAPTARPAPATQHAPVAAQAAASRLAETRPVAEPAPQAKGQETVAVTRPAPPRLFSGYALQAGVFADPRLAEELHAKLTLNGIPSTLETRVQVGPFKTREEAAAAHVKLKALGIDAVMLTPAKGIARR